MSTATKPNDAWTDYDPPAVEETAVPFTYVVTSRSNPQMHHTVDLTQRGGHGACTCENFRFRAAANFRRHGKHIPFAAGREGVSECAHIRAALDHMHIHVTIPMLHRMANGIPSSKSQS